MNDEKIDLAKRIELYLGKSPLTREKPLTPCEQYCEDRDAEFTLYAVFVNDGSNCEKIDSDIDKIVAKHGSIGREKHSEICLHFTDVDTGKEVSSPVSLEAITVVEHYGGSHIVSYTREIKTTDLKGTNCKISAISFRDNAIGERIIQSMKDLGYEILKKY